MRFLTILAALAVAFAAGGARAQDTVWFGASVETVTPQMMEEKGLAVPFGVRVGAVEEGSPAAEAGLAEGDVVISVNGAPVADAPAFEAAIGKLAVGSLADLVRVRGKETPSPVKITLAEKPQPHERGDGAPPLLMLDTGGHMSKIQRILFTPDERFIVSASNDKAIRVWDWRAGKTVREIRGESGPGDEGKIYAMAMSPDGAMLAAAGWLSAGEEHGSVVRLYDFASGTLLHLLKGHGDVILSLAFSPDGRRLVSGSADDSAIIWEVAPPSGQAPRQLHRLEGHQASIYAIAFTPDGQRVVTGSDDATLRLWKADDGSLIQEMKGHKRDVDRALAVRRSDSLIASGDATGEIRLWDGKTGRFLRTLVVQPTQVGALVFTPDGSKLLSTCGSGGCAGAPQHLWDVATGKEVISYAEHDNIVLAAAISADGRLAATAGGNGFPVHVWEIATGQRVAGPDGRPLSLAGTGEPKYAAGFAPKHHMIVWGNTDRGTVNSRKEPYEFFLRLPAEGGALGKPERLKPEASGDAPRPDGGDVGPHPSEADFLRASDANGAYALRHQTGGNYGFDAVLEIVKDGEVAARLERGTTDGYQHRSYTFTPDGKTIVSGGDNGQLHAYDVASVISAAKGGTLKGSDLSTHASRFIGHEGDVWAVTASPDGKYLVSGAADQTVRLWNVKTRELIVTLFNGRDGEWVMWTPQGYYTGSPGGGALVGWQVNKGPEKAAEYVRGRQLRQKLLRPDIVERAIVLASASAAVGEAGLVAVSIDTLLAHTPPVLFAQAPAEAAGGRAMVIVSSQKNALPILRTKITVGDGTQERTVEPRPVALPPGTPQPERGATLRAYDVSLFKGKNEVRIVAVNAAGESEPITVAVTHNGEGALDKRGTLWLLAVGADKYPGAKKIVDAATGQVFEYADLRYAGADAQAFAETAAAEMQGQHTKVDVTVLVNGPDPAKAPTRANILAALKRIQDQSRDTDTIVILLAGHGENWQGGRYHFLPTDLQRTSLGDVGENVLDWAADVQPSITGAKGRKLLFLDACHSGNAHNKTLLAAADADRFVAFSAAGPDELANEFATEGHGAFTYMLIQGLKGVDAALDPLERAVTVYALGQFVNVEVRRRTNGKQTPEFRSGQGNFVLARE